MTLARSTVKAQNSTFKTKHFRAPYPLLFTLLLVSSNAFAQQPDVQVKLDIVSTLSSGLKGPNTFQWYDLLGHYSTVGLSATLTKDIAPSFQSDWRPSAETPTPISSTSTTSKTQAFGSWVSNTCRSAGNSC